MNYQQPYAYPPPSQQPLYQEYQPPQAFYPTEPVKYGQYTIYKASATASCLFQMIEVT